MSTPETAHRTLDAAEVAQFGSRAAAWWDPAGAFAPLHALGPARLAYVREAVTRHFGRAERSFRPFSGLAMLDVGCGGGLISEPLARLGGAVTGIDPASENIEVARAHAEGQGLAISYRAERLEDLVAAGAAFDIVVCLEVLEHVPAPQDFVGLLARVVKPGGLLVLSTINRTAAAYALAVVGAERVLGWLPAGTHQWDRFITPDELAGYCRAAALVPSPGRGLVYDVMQGEWRLGDDTAINYLISATRSAA